MGGGGGWVREEEATKITILTDIQGGGGRWGEMSWEGAATKIIRSPGLQGGEGRWEEMSWEGEATKIIRSSKSDKSEAKKMNKCGAGNKYF